MIESPPIIIPRSVVSDEVIVLRILYYSPPFRFPLIKLDTQQVSIHNFFNMDKEGLSIMNTNNVNAAQGLKLMKIERIFNGFVPHRFFSRSFIVKRYSYSTFEYGAA